MGEQLALSMVHGFSLAPWLGRCQAEARHRSRCCRPPSGRRRDPWGLAATVAAV